MDTYTIAAERSALSVSVRRILRGRGTFPRIAGAVTVDEHDIPQSLHISIDVRSLRTGLSLRDQHLKSIAFLDAQRYPLSTYATEQIDLVGSDRYTIAGMMRLHGHERHVTLEARLEPEPTDGTDDARQVRFSGVVSGSAFAIPPNPLLRMLVRVMFGDEVSVTGTICLVPARDSVPAEAPSLQGSLSQG